LPGIGYYDGSSDSEDSSSSDVDEITKLNQPQFDLCGRLVTEDHD